MRAIDDKNINRHPSNRGTSGENSPVPLKMVHPHILARMKQAHNFTCVGIHSRPATFGPLWLLQA